MKFENSAEKRVSAKHFANFRMADFKNKRILDIGCGNGLFEKYNFEDSKSILGIDLNKNEIEIARSQLKNKKVQFVVLGALNLNKIKKKFDYVVLFDVIEHLPKRKEIFVLKEATKLLNRGGKILISTPRDNFSKFLDIAWYFGHRHYTYKKIKEIISETGLRLDKIYSGGGIVDLFSILLFYPCKWILRSEIPFKNWFDKKKMEEYSSKKGIITIFAICSKR